MAGYLSKKRKRAGANIKPIEDMVKVERTSAESYFEKLEESKNKGVVIDMKDVNNVELANEVEREDKEMMLNELYGKEVVIDEETLRQKEIVDSNIKYAILKSKNVGKRGILAKQYRGIVAGYERELGIAMTEAQTDFLKTITETQAVEVLKVLNAYNRYKVNKAIQQRIQARKLATNE